MTQHDEFESEPSHEELTDLERHWSRIHGVQLGDFRVTALTRLVQAHISGHSVLDVGCGTAALVINLAKEGYAATGIDVSPEMVRNAKESLRMAGLSPELVRLFDVNDVEERYSAILSLDVLEHLEDDLGMVRAMSNALLPEGRLIVTVPACPWLFGPKDIKLGHLRRYTRERLRSVLDASGLKTVKLRYWNAVGLIPTIVASKIRGQEVSEEFRYKRTLTATIIHRVLSFWMTQVENRIPLPLGLSLFAVAEKSAAEDSESRK
jgi:2-polyprenyl-3-methyl-5-hydroxy-6-metoxy-1,4-benzoquinol methylase